MKCDLEDPCGNCRKASKECTPAVRHTKPRFVKLCVQWLIVRPTHDQIEQLQNKVDNLEGFLRSLSGADPVYAAEALNEWQAAGGSAGGPSTSAHRHVPRSSVASTSMAAPELPEAASFDSPIGDQYIYDNSG
jgi:hypothetical protein